MSHLLNCIMLVDDDEDDNFFHEKEIVENHIVETVVVRDSARKALEYIKSGTEPLSDLIFLDINMPGMTGWEFLTEYRQLTQELLSKPVIVMLSTSVNPKDMEKAKTSGLVSDYVTKPLTKDLIEAIIEKWF